MQYSDEDDTCSEKIESDAYMTINNGFIYLGISHDFKYPPKILYLSLKENGSFDQSILKIVDEIKIKLVEKGFHPIFQSTDGDPGVSSLHNNFYDKFIKKNESNFESICEKA